MPIWARRHHISLKVLRVHETLSLMPSSSSFELEDEHQHISTSTRLGVEPDSRAADDAEAVPPAFVPSACETISGWLSACHNGHLECGAVGRRRGTMLPSRLIDVSDYRSQGLFRLVYSAILDPSVRYTTLSHCWGGYVPLRLMRGNHDAMLRGMSSDELPVTFADAASITSGLSVDYIWIDSLCIIPD
jgi:hypothetical protein